MPRFTFVRPSRAAALGLVTYGALLLAGCQVGRPGGQVTLNPGDDLGKAAREHPAGTTFRLNPGVYRRQQIEPKDGQRFFGNGKAVLDGSMILAGWSRADGLWRAAGLPRPLYHSGFCEDKGTACQYPEDLFVDGKLYRRVLKKQDLGPGRWYYEGGAAHLRDDPRGKTVELSVTEQAFYGFAEGVTIRNLVVQKYASRGQTGAIDASKGRNWRVIDVVAQWNHGIGLRIGDGIRVVGGRYVHNGQLGIGTVGSDIVIDSVEAAYNNYAGYAIGWEAGGMKFLESRNVTVQRSCFHHNNGTGLWGDANNVKVLITKNKIFANQSIGLQYETSFEARIADNLIAYNNLNKDLIWFWGADVLIQNSEDVTFERNRVEVALGVGVGMIFQKRERDSGGIYLTRNNRVMDNIIIHLDEHPAEQRFNGMGADFERERLRQGRNLFERNTYIVPRADGEYWFFDGQPRAWSAVTQFGMEREGKRIIARRSRTPLDCSSGPVSLSDRFAPGTGG